MLEQIAQEVRQCQACRLAATRKLSVPGEGPANAAIMCIGEGPGFHENEQGRPFVGQAGKLLGELLAAAGLMREDVFIANVVKCRPPENRDPQEDELAACANYLDRQIAAINPLIIVTLGRISMGRYFQNARISAIHGHASWVDGRMIVAMYHPAAALHQPNLKADLLHDFAGLPALIEKAHAGRTKPAAPTQTQPTETHADDTEQLRLF
jgi:DNA polymerase